MPEFAAPLQQAAAGGRQAQLIALGKVCREQRQDAAGQIGQAGGRARLQLRWPGRLGSKAQALQALLSGIDGTGVPHEVLQEAGR